MTIFSLPTDTYLDYVSLFDNSKKSLKINYSSRIVLDDIIMSISPGKSSNVFMVGLPNFDEYDPLQYSAITVAEFTLPTGVRIIPESGIPQNLSENLKCSIESGITINLDNQTVVYDTIAKIEMTLKKSSHFTILKMFKKNEIIPSVVNQSISSSSRINPSN